MHIYGVCLIVAGAITCTKLRKLDYTRPVQDIKQQLAAIRKHYLYSGAYLGLSWWLLWFPLCITLGADALMYPPTFWISVGIGLAGLISSSIFYRHLLNSEKPWAEKWVRELAGESLTLATQRLNELEEARLK